MKKEELVDFNIEVGKLLFDAYENRSALLFPCYRNEDKRVSEQESRVIFCYLLFDKGIRFSIETPTSGIYGFSGEGKRSAMVDLTIYNPQNKPQVHIEFKSGNPEQGPITKDFIKLAHEKVCGNWFHTLQNVDSGTIPSLIKKFNKALADDKVNYEGSPEILVFLVALDLRCYFYYSLGGSFERLPDIEYAVVRNSIVNRSLNGWNFGR